MKPSNLPPGVTDNDIEQGAPPGASPRVYLGDSVYARWENGYVVLTTENGYGASNEIYLESAVLEALEMWLERAP